ncbi:MAG: hypothetical protein ACI9VR_001928 [Cognaticolwellia sp.]|jgi:hypothetical protein
MLLLLLACAPVDVCQGSPDPDGDGLSDCEEAELGSDPALADSDGDGFTGVTGDPAKPQDAIDYAGAVDDPSIPVFADPARDILNNTPYDGKELPGKCLLSPSMEIVSCWTGHENDDEALEIVRTQGAQ